MSLLHLVGFPLLAMLSACQSQARSDSDGSGLGGASLSGVLVLEVEPSVYQPTLDSPPSGSEASACQAWSLDAQQAASFFALSTQLSEGALHDFSWLPCTIKGRLESEGQEWAFEINAAGTSTWRAGNETRLLGCAHSACEPFVILMSENVQD